MGRDAMSYPPPPISDFTGLVAVVTIVSILLTSLRLRYHKRFIHQLSQQFQWLVIFQVTPGPNRFHSLHIHPTDKYR